MKRTHLDAVADAGQDRSEGGGVLGEGTGLHQIRQRLKAVRLTELIDQTAINETLESRNTNMERGNSPDFDAGAVLLSERGKHAQSGSLDLRKAEQE